ncbi:MAG: glycosyltransferase, partial [Bacteroidetes bacterium]|nr:glycosyltransferase [Bacteroidota bacterium]
NLGVAAALNTGLRAANTEIIARFDADDICMPDRLEKQFVFLQNNPDYILTGCEAEYIMENGEHLFNFSCANYTDEKIKKEINRHCPFIHSGVMFRKKAVLDAGGYSLHAYGFEDHFLWATLIKKGKCCNLPYPLIKVRFNANSFTIDERWRGKNFRRIKQKAISTGSISEKEGNQLARIIKQQQTKKIKHGSYHALCCKKFLADNFQPLKAREHAGKAIFLNPARIDNYAMLFTTYLPQKMVRWITRIKRTYN